MNDLRALTPEQKQALLKAALRKRPSAANAPDGSALPEYARQSYDMFMAGADPELSEITRFEAWVESSRAAGVKGTSIGGYVWRDAISSRRRSNMSERP